MGWAMASEEEAAILKKTKKWDFSDTHTCSSLRSNESKTTKSEWLNIKASELVVEDTLKILSFKGLLEAMSREVVLNPEMLDCWPLGTHILILTLHIRKH